MANLDYESKSPPPASDQTFPNLGDAAWITAGLSIINGISIFVGNVLVSLPIGVILGIGSLVIAFIALRRSWRVTGKYQRIYVGAIVCLIVSMLVVTYDLFVWHSIVTGGF